MLAAIIIIAILALLLLIPVVINAEYNTSGFEISVRCAIFRFVIRKKSVKAGKAGQIKRIKEKISNLSFEELHKLVKIAFEALERLKNQICIDRLSLKYVSAANDPCDTAMRYATANAAVAAILPILEQGFKIKKREVSITADYEAEDSSFELSTVLSLMLVHALYFVLIIFKSITSARLKSAYGLKKERKSGRG